MKIALEDSPTKERARPKVVEKKSSLDDRLGSFEGEKIWSRYSDTLILFLILIRRLRSSQEAPHPQEGAGRKGEVSFSRRALSLSILTPTRSRKMILMIYSTTLVYIQHT